jgi:uncharacterized repeat protein (TIGR03803 family)
MARKRLSPILNKAAWITFVILTLVLAASAQHNFKVLYQFPGVESGFAPSNSLRFDSAGNLYGNLVESDYNTGIVYQLTPNPDGSWTQKNLYQFTGGADGAAPQGDLARDAAGNFYGTTVNLFGGVGAGVVFKLTPNSDGTWTESVLYSFTGGADGNSPYSGVIIDKAGNLYGTTYSGGDYSAGAVFKLTPNPDGTWTQSVLYSFTGGADGANPQSGLTFDTAGNLYGVTPNAGAGGGVVFKLTLSPDGTWTQSLLFTFTHAQGGANPQARLTFDRAGNLYGTTVRGGTSGNGTVFQLQKNTDGSWTEQVLHRFSGGSDGCFPEDGLTIDRAGNLYGTTQNCGDNGYGVAFQLKRQKTGGWTSQVLHQFTVNDGIGPKRMIFDKAGNLYGTACCGGAYGYGTVFEIVR